MGSLAKSWAGLWSPLTFCRQTRRSYELRTTGARRNYHLIKHVQRPLQLLHLQLSVHSVQMGLVRTESQSPEPSARSNLGEIPPSLSLQRLFPISSSLTSGPRCEHVRSNLLGNFLFARHPRVTGR